MTKDHEVHVRGSGRTSKQMQGALKGAIYVWVDNNIRIAKKLAEAVDRDDLKIISPHKLTCFGYFASRHIPEIIVDHAAELTDEQWSGLERIWPSINKNTRRQHNDQTN
ncbi:MAG: hypothetical protein MJA29_11525 [Candidatus Omnitrophica bacterium]|nr:hypothetical protein [Candidatus Omnitrophota bacterium]